MPECAGTPTRRARRRHVRPPAEPWRRRCRCRRVAGPAGRQPAEAADRHGRSAEAAPAAPGAQAPQAGRAPRADPADAGHHARAAGRRAHHHRGAGGAAVGQRSGAVPPLRQQGADVRGADRVHRIQRVHAGQPDPRARGRRRRADAAHRHRAAAVRREEPGHDAGDGRRRAGLRARAPDRAHEPVLRPRRIAAAPDACAWPPKPPARARRRWTRRRWPRR